MEIETDSKSDALSLCWRNRNAPQLTQIRVLSVRTETLEGGVVVRFPAKLFRRFVAEVAAVELGRAAR